MRKIISFMHVSLDGFVAGPSGEMDWITVDNEIFDYVGERVSHTNKALYGRKTFEMMEGYWPTAADKPDASKHDIDHSQWYKQAKKIVLSATLDERDFTNVTIISGNVAGRLGEVKNSGDNSDILLFGSPTATHLLMVHDLIDGYWLFVNPILVGEGIPLFKHIRNKSQLQLVDTRKFATGVIALNYLTNQAAS